MNIKKNADAFIVKISNKEKEIFLTSLAFLVNDIEEEFFIRLGYYLNEYEVLAKAIRRGKEIFSEAELLMIRQVFNEICYGVSINNFEAAIGCSLNDARKIFDTIDCLLT